MTRHWPSKLIAGSKRVDVAQRRLPERSTVATFTGAPTADFHRIDALETGVE
jgi:hypothetical protein